MVPGRKRTRAPSSFPAEAVPLLGTSRAGCAIETPVALASFERTQPHLPGEAAFGTSLTNRTWPLSLPSPVGLRPPVPASPAARFAWLMPTLGDPRGSVKRYFA